MSSAPDPAPGAPAAPLPADAAASLARSSALMASGTLVSRVLGFLRGSLLSTAIGATAAVGGQVFDIANKAPNIFYMLLAGGVLNAVLVPQIVRAMKLPDGGKEYIDRLITLALVLMAAATVALTAAAPQVVRLYSSGWADDWIALATAMAFWCLPQVFFYGLYTVLGQVLNAKGSFGPYMWAPVANNVVAVAGIVAFIVLVPGADKFSASAWTPEMIALLAGTSTLGVALQGVILIWPLHRAGFHYRPRWGFRGIGLRTAGRVAGWTFAGVVAGQLVYVFTSKVATAAGQELNDLKIDGATGPSYTNAFLLFMLPHSLVAVSLVTALFTRLSSAAARGDVATVRRDFSSGARTVSVVGALATAGFVALGPSVGAALFQDGRPIGQVIVSMTLGLVPFSVTYLVQRVFYAYEDAKTPFMVSVVVAAVLAAGNLVCWLVVPAQWAVVGIGASMSVSNIVGGVLALVLLRRRMRRLDGGGIDGYRLLRTLVRLLLIGSVSALAGAVVAHLGAPYEDTRLASVAIVVVGGVVVLTVFAVLCRLMRVRELEELLAPLLRRVPGLRRG